VAERVNILQFMVIRPANLPAAESIRRSYIRDDSLQRTGFADADLFSEDSLSEIGKIVYTSVFCDGAGLPLRTSTANLTGTGSILMALLGLLRYYDAPCPNPQAVDGLVLESLPDRSYVLGGNRIYLIPDRLSDVSAPLITALPEVLALARAATAMEPPATLNKKALIEAIRKALGVNRLEGVVFEGASRSGAFADAKRKLFDTLYLLYILRRRLSVRLEAIIDGLRAKLRGALCLPGEPGYDTARTIWNGPIVLTPNRR